MRDFAFMPLDVVRLRDSDLTATPDGEVFRAAVLSWCVSWHQQPAASLPDDDAVLARLLGYGRDVKGWLRLRAAGALRGYIKCSDERLYHPVVAEKANEAWLRKCAQRDRTESARKARLLLRQSQKEHQVVTDESESVTDPPQSVTESKVSVADDVTESKGQGQGQGQLKKKETTPPNGGSSMWDFAVSMLGDQGVREATARSFIGSLCREWSEPHVEEAIRASVGKANAKGYILGFLKEKPKKGGERKVAI